MQVRHDETKPKIQKDKFKAYSKFLNNPQQNSLEQIKRLSKANVTQNNAHKDFSMRNIAVAAAAECNRVDVMQWLVEEMECPTNVVPLSRHPVIVAIQHHQLEALNWLLERDKASSIISECIEACIFYNNLTALKIFFKDERFPFRLGKKSFLFSEDLKPFSEENMTTYMIEQERFNMFLWYVDNDEDGFESDLLNKCSRTILRLYDFFKGLEVQQLKQLRPILESAFEKAEINTKRYAIDITSELDVIIGMKSFEKNDELVPTPSTISALSTPALSAPETPFGSPKKSSYLNNMAVFGSDFHSKLMMLNLNNEMDLGSENGDIGNGPS